MEVVLARRRYDVIHQQWFGTERAARGIIQNQRVVLGSNVKPLKLLCLDLLTLRL
jgi:hypothetical protein